MTILQALNSTKDKTLIDEVGYEVSHQFAISLAYACIDGDFDPCEEYVVDERGIQLNGWYPYTFKEEEV